MKSMLLMSIFVAWITLSVQVTSAKGEHLTVEIVGGQEQCFFVLANENQDLTVDYVVVSTTHGALDVNFQLLDPIGRPLLTEFRKSRSVQVFQLKNNGVYSACFDNTYTRSVKHVNFILSLDSDSSKANWHQYDIKNLAPVSEKEAELNKDMLLTMDRVRISLQKVAVHQEQLMNSETRDRSIAESNFVLVNFWSLINLCAMILVGLVQVYLVKHLFGYDANNVFEYLQKIKNVRGLGK